MFCQSGTASHSQRQRDASNTGPLVVVEGNQDLRAVRRALPACQVILRCLLGHPGYLKHWRMLHGLHLLQVFVLHSANRSKSAATLQALQQQAAQHERVVVFLDNDTAGRQGRKVLDQALPACWHAFLPLTLEDVDRSVDAWGAPVSRMSSPTCGVPRVSACCATLLPLPGRANICLPLPGRATLSCSIAALARQGQPVGQLCRLCQASRPAGCCWKELCSATWHT